MITTRLLKPSIIKYKPLHDGSFAERIFGKYGSLNRDFWNSISFIFRKSPGMAQGKQTNLYRLYQSILTSHPAFLEREILYFTQSILQEKVIERMTAQLETEKQILIKPVFLQDKKDTKQISYIKSFNELKLYQSMLIRMANSRYGYKQVYDIALKLAGTIEREKAGISRGKGLSTQEYVRVREYKPAEGIFESAGTPVTAGLAAELLLNHIRFSNYTVNHFGKLYTDSSTRLEQNTSAISAFYLEKENYSKRITEQYTVQYTANIDNHYRVLRSFDAYIEKSTVDKAVRQFIKKTREAVPGGSLFETQNATYQFRHWMEPGGIEARTERERLLRNIEYDRTDIIRTNKEKEYIEAWIRELELRLDHESARKTNLLALILKEQNSSIGRTVLAKESRLLKRLYASVEIPAAEPIAAIIQRNAEIPDHPAVYRGSLPASLYLTQSFLEGDRYYYSRESGIRGSNPIRLYAEKSIWNRLARAVLKETSAVFGENRETGIIAANGQLRTLVKLLIENSRESITDSRSERLDYSRNSSMESRFTDTVRQYFPGNSMIDKEGPRAGNEAGSLTTDRVLRLKARRQFSRDVLYELKELLSHSESRSDSSLLRETERAYIEARFSELERQLDYERIKEASLFERFVEKSAVSISERVREKESSILEKLYGYVETPAVIQDVAEIIQKHMNTLESSTAWQLTNYYGTSYPGIEYKISHEADIGTETERILNSFAERSVWDRLTRESLNERTRASQDTRLESRSLSVSNSRLRTLVKLLIENNRESIADSRSERLDYSRNSSMESRFTDTVRQYFPGSSMIDKEGPRAGNEAVGGTTDRVLRLGTRRQFSRDVLRELRQLLSHSEGGRESSLLQETERAYIEARLSELERQLDYERVKEASLFERLAEKSAVSISEGVREKESSILEKLYGYVETPAVIQDVAEIIQKHMNTPESSTAVQLTNYYGTSYPGIEYKISRQTDIRTETERILNSFAERSVWDRLTRESLNERTRASQDTRLESRLLNVSNSRLRTLVKLLIENNRESIADSRSERLDYSRNSSMESRFTDTVRQYFPGNSMIDKEGLQAGNEAVGGTTDRLLRLETRRQFNRDVLHELKELVSRLEGGRESSFLRETERAYIEARLSELERQLDYERVKEASLLERLVEDNVSSISERVREKESSILEKLYGYMETPAVIQDVAEIIQKHMNTPESSTAVQLTNYFSRLYGGPEGLTKKIPEGNMQQHTFASTRIHNNLLSYSQSKAYGPANGGLLSSITGFTEEKLELYNTVRALKNIDRLTVREKYTTIRRVEENREELALRSLNPGQAGMESGDGKMEYTALQSSPVALEYRKAGQQDKTVPGAPEAGSTVQSAGKEPDVSEKSGEEKVRIPETEMLRIVDRVYDEIERKLRLERHSRGIY